MKTSGKVDEVALRRQVLGVSEQEARFITALQSGRLKGDTRRPNQQTATQAVTQQVRTNKPKNRPARVHPVYIREGDKLFQANMGGAKWNALTSRVGRFLRLQIMGRPLVAADSINALRQADMRVIVGTETYQGQPILVVESLPVEPSDGFAPPQAEVTIIRARELDTAKASHTRT